MRERTRWSITQRRSTKRARGDRSTFLPPGGNRQDLNASKVAENKEQLEEEVNSILVMTDDAVVPLRESFPSLEILVSEHEDVDFSTTAALVEYIESADPIQRIEEEALLAQSEESH